MSARQGVTLLELLLALVCVGLLAGTVTRVFREQSRSLRTSGDLIEMRSQLRQATHLLGMELRPLMPTRGDLHEWSTTRLVLRSVTGTSITCAATDSTLTIPPLASPEEEGRSPTDWLVQPQPGDSILVLDGGPSLGDADDRWRAWELAAITPTTSTQACPPPLWAAPADESAPAWRLHLAGGTAIPRTIGAGSPIRIFHTARHELYRSGDGQWHLGTADCRPGRVPRCSTIQPVSGPYLPRAGTGRSGLELRYLDPAGTLLDPATDDPTRVALVQATVRAETGLRWRERSRLDGIGDSANVLIAIRNRPLR